MFVTCIALSCIPFIANTPNPPFSSNVYAVGLEMGVMTPCFISTRGFVLSWKVSFVCHSGPMGRRR